MAYVGFVKRINDLVERASLLGHGEHSHYAPPATAVQLGFAAIKCSGMQFQRILKGAYVRGDEAIQRFIETVDAHIADDVMDLLRLPSADDFASSPWSGWHSTAKRTSRL
eukprot:m.1276 g.1276  ORF g.1276 m.1276 type:complete len:110 (+) comp452_c0_seq1:111-440(+)